MVTAPHNMNAVQIARLKRERLAADLRKLDDFIAMAEALEKESGLVAPTTQQNSASIEYSLPPVPRLTIRDRVEASVKSQLSEFGSRKTQQFLDFMLQGGLDPAPKVKDPAKKRNALSTLLSKFDFVVNDRAAKVWRFKPGMEGNE